MAFSFSQFEQAKPARFGVPYFEMVHVLKRPEPLGLRSAPGASLLVRLEGAFTDEKLLELQGTLEEQDFADAGAKGIGEQLRLKLRLLLSREASNSSSYIFRSVRRFLFLGISARNSPSVRLPDFSISFLEFTNLLLDDAVFFFLIPRIAHLPIAEKPPPLVEVENGASEFMRGQFMVEAPLSDFVGVDAVEQLLSLFGGFGQKAAPREFPL